MQWLSDMLTQRQPELGTSLPLPGASHSSVRSLAGSLETAMNGPPRAFEIASGIWQICEAPSSRWPMLVEPRSALPAIGEAHLSFEVSSDEEHVHLRMTSGRRTFDMGSRAHNYLLLTLARQRLQDQEKGLADTRCGWMLQDDLAPDPMMAPPRLNIDVFRIRRQLAARGIVDSAGIIERRPRARQLRIGTGHLCVVRV